MLIKSIKLFLLEKKIQAARASKNIRIKTEECKQPLHHSDHDSYESFSKNQNRGINSINNQENLDNPTLKWDEAMTFIENSTVIIHKEVRENSRALGDDKNDNFKSLYSPYFIANMKYFDSDTS